MAENMMLKLPDGRVIQGSVNEILSFLSNYSNGSPLVSSELLDDFIIWLKRRGISVGTIRDYSRALEKFIGMTIDELSPSSNVQVKAVRNYVKFLWERGIINYENMLRYLARFRVLKHSRQKYYVIDEEQLVKAAFSRSGKAGVVLRLLYYSGARGSEIVKMLSEWNPGEEVMLPGGYLTKRFVCNSVFCRYYLGWRRGRKSCEWIFFPREMLEEIKLSVEKQEYASYGYIKVFRNKLGFPSKLYRKLHYNICVKASKSPDICSFIQSRSGGVSREHYMIVLRFADEVYPILLRGLEKLRNRYV